MPRTRDRITKLARQISKRATFEDRLEYDAEMLAQMYRLTLLEAEQVRTILHRIAAGLEDTP
jgi:hypothetical protein